MSSSTMREPLAIRLQNVSKIYKLHGSQSDQLIDVLGLQRFGIKAKKPSKEFAALSDISLEVPRGHRIGIVGRNGAGKTTLLKLICGNFAPTSGEVEVNGTVQALMNIGLGFHPEYTGRENVEASLQYNGLARDEYQKAMEGIIDFCELGDFLDQPFKTYSLGMQARLMFASATAISPDILIVDEVLGAGDAYFVAKSKIRVQRMIEAGCTMLLVSHSMQQVLELCDEAIWLDGGQIRMRGESLLVVKAYEEYINGPVRHVMPDQVEAINSQMLPESTSSNECKQTKLDFLETFSRNPEDIRHLQLQAPAFLPHGQTPKLPSYFLPAETKFVIPGGVSRWESEKGLKICGFTIVTERGETNKLISTRPAKFILNIVAEYKANFDFRCGLVFLDHMGRTISKIISPCDSVYLSEGQTHCVEMLLNPVQLGPGDYILSISLHKYDVLEKFNVTGRFDLVARSSCFTVSMPESMLPLSAEFIHSAEWSFKSDEI
jgi:lipopolysaccharide transport system ATP-binding protein